MSARKPLDTARYDAENLAQARRVLEHPERHGAGLVRWAEMVVDRIEREHGQTVPARRGSPDLGGGNLLGGLREVALGVAAGANRGPDCPAGLGEEAGSGSGSSGEEAQEQEIGRAVSLATKRTPGDEQESIA